MYALEDKFLEISSSSAYVAQIYCFYMYFSRWSFGSQILWQYIFIDTSWMCIILDFLKISKFGFLWGFHDSTEKVICT